MKFLWENYLDPSVSKHREEKIYHVALLFGDDFTYTDANRSFNYLNILIEKLNSSGKTAFGKKVIAFYSNMTSYTNAKASHGKTYKKYRGDFLPYAQKWDENNNFDYWTGYYSSRMELKEKVREMTRTLRQVKSL